MNLMSRDSLLNQAAQSPDYPDDVQRPELSNAIRAHVMDRRARLLGGHQTRRRIKAKAAKGPRKNILFGVFDRSIQIGGWHKGWEYRAQLRRDGRIRYDEEIYYTPSGAGRAARGRSTNGWTFWHYKRGNDWVKIAWNSCAS